MNCRTQVVLAAGIGYLLGRQRKLRWGLLLGAAAATGRLSRPGGLLQHGVRALGSSPEIGKLGELGAPLVGAAKDAARAAVTGRIGSMTDRMRGRADALREPWKARKPAEPEDREPEELDEDREPEEEVRSGRPGARERPRPSRNETTRKSTAPSGARGDGRSGGRPPVGHRPLRTTSVTTNRGDDGRQGTGAGPRAVGWAATRAPQGRIACHGCAIEHQGRWGHRREDRRVACAGAGEPALGCRAAGGRRGRPEGRFGDRSADRVRERSGWSRSGVSSR